MKFNFLNSISDGDQDFISDFVATYEQHTIALVEQFKIAYSSGDLTLLKKIAHQLKPTGEILEFSNLPYLVNINQDPSSATGDQVTAIYDEALGALEELKVEYQL